MSDESGRKGTGRMKLGNLTHSRSKNELDELPERQYGTKYHSFLRVPVNDCPPPPPVYLRL
ncbi:hypothetical protein B0H13DRAFT_2314402 [Mycena leptocephala]|nr:hypothetical protein B0H13DRAFT_2314402 [Mycena leptocephala]